jgi:SnoaL-like domain
MSEMAIPTAAPEEIALTVLSDLKNGKIDEAIAGFAEEFTFEDHGLGLKFKNKERLSEFFRKTRELYPHSILDIDTIFVSADHVSMEWRLQTEVTEPFYSGVSRKVQVTVHGASFIRVVNGRVVSWVDYYDGGTSRRTALGAHFTEWVAV